VEAFLQTFNEAAMERRIGRCESVVVPQAVFSPQNQTGLAKVREMARRFGLRDLRDGYDVADADFALQEQMQDSQPGTVGECPKHEIDGRCGHRLYSPKRI
jgi:hypothetical protein